MPKTHAAHPHYGIPLCGAGWLAGAARDARASQVTCRSCLKRLKVGVLYLEQKSGATILWQWPFPEETTHA